MELSLSLNQTQTLEIQSPWGMSRSVFPKVEEMLENSEYRKAVDYVAKRKKQDRYVCVIDFLLCEVMPQHQAGCFRFYADEGPRFKELVSEEEITRCESVILVFLAIAYHYFCEDRQLSWKQARIVTGNFFDKNKGEEE